MNRLRKAAWAVTVIASVAILAWYAVAATTGRACVEAAGWWLCMELVRR